MYSFLILFLTLPLYFSHVFQPLGLTIGESYSFERQKMYLFLILIGVALIEGMIRFPESMVIFLKKYGYVFLFLMISPIFSALYFGDGVSSDFLIGSHEKHHGYLFYLGVLSFILLMSVQPISYLRKYISWSIFSSVIVAIIAIGEHMGGVSDIYGRSEMISMYVGRSSSTLGNPNYVAGYLLFFVPILIQDIAILKNKTGINIEVFISKIVMLGILLGGIYTTGSYIALFLLGMLSIWYLIVYFLSSLEVRWQILIFLFFVTPLVLGGFCAIDSEKLLSFESRFILMKESLLALFHYPLSFVFGFGPDSILSYFSNTRSSLLDSYFPSSMFIDSSHNIGIDILFQYGLIPIIFLCRFLYQKRAYMFSFIGISFIIGFMFLSFNVFVITHIVIGILCMTFLDKNTEENKKIQANARILR